MPLTFVWTTLSLKLLTPNTSASAGDDVFIAINLLAFLFLCLYETVLKSVSKDFDDRSG